jgi:diadenosine tetraphosphate (Ap4A) HIT family hydrolase
MTNTEKKVEKFEIKIPKQEINKDEIKEEVRKEFANLQKKSLKIDHSKNIDFENIKKEEQNKEELYYENSKKESEPKIIIEETEKKVEVQKEIEPKIIKEIKREIEPETFENIVEKEELISTIPKEEKTIPKVENNDFKFIIYQDDKLTCFINEKSQILGEINIISKLKTNFDVIDQNDFAYMSIFSKVFAGILFETLNASGTNIIYNYKSNSIKIVPRFNEDNLKLDWTSRKDTNEFLEEIKNKLLITLKNPNLKKEIEKTEEITNIDIDKIESPKIVENVETQVIEKNKKIKKAEFILHKLSKLP